MVRWRGRSLLLCSALVSGCAGPGASAPGGAQLPEPLRPPGPGAGGCVESAELKAFVLALEAERARARARALERLGAVERPRQSRFVAAAGLGDVVEEGGQRFVVVGRLATSAPPLVPLVQREQLVQLLDERPRAHPVPVIACGMKTCPAPAAPSLPPLRALAVPLNAGERLGPPLQLSYDYWWAQVSYDRARSSPPLPSGAAGKR